MLTEGMVDLAQAEVGRHCQAKISEVNTDGQVSLSHFDGLVVVACPPQISGTFVAPGNCQRIYALLLPISGITKVGKSFSPVLTPERMMRKPVYAFGDPVGIKSLKDLDCSSVEVTPALLQEACVGDLMGKGVPKGVFNLWEEGAFIHELPDLEQGEARTKLLSDGSRSIRAARTACTVAGI
jgi:hypothetical protein